MIQHVSLRDHCELITKGTTPTTLGKAFVDSGIPFLRVQNLQDWKVVLDDVLYIDKETDRMLARSRIKPNDVLISIAGTIGRSAVVPRDAGDLNCNQAVAIVRLKDSIDIRYLLHWLNTRDASAQMTGTKVTGTIANLSLTSVGNLRVPLPPLEEQTRIAEVLDRADALRQKRRLAIEKLHILIQSIFLDMFGDPRTNPKGWKQSPLGSLCDIGSSKRVFVEDLVEKGIPFYRGTEVGSLGEGLAITPSLFITEKHYEELIEESGAPRPGDLLLPSICPDGRIYIVRDKKPFYFKDGRVLWIKAGQSGINSTFLRYHLKHLFAADYAKIASGTTFAELKIFALKALEVHVPPTEQQTRFERFVDGCERQMSKMRLHLAELSAFFTSLQVRAFKGELNAR
jgi:type I restriction enzyme S subunit